MNKFNKKINQKIVQRVQYSVTVVIVRSTKLQNHVGIAKKIRTQKILNIYGIKAIGLNYYAKISFFINVQ